MSDRLRVMAGADAIEFLVELRYRMNEDGITQKDLAKRIGVKRSQLNRWLRQADNLNAKSMFLLARGLGYTLKQSWERAPK